MVSTSLYTGLSGLRVHQSYIDVIGNNLANVSTPGFRGSRPTFSDLLSFTVRSGAGPNGDFGGLNPLQIGHGAVMSTVDTNTNQGTFQDTGRSMDVALQGRGFFTLTNGTQNFYTRVGTFGIDADRTLVDLRSGLRVVGASGGDISVPVSDTLPAVPSSNIRFQGNLPARVGGPLQEIVQSSAVFKQGTPATKNASSVGTPSWPQFDLTSLVSSGNKTVLVSVNGGAQQTITFSQANFGAPPTGPGPVSASTIANLFSGVTGLSVTADDIAGTIAFDTIKLGDSANVKFDDGPGSTGMLAAMGLDATLDRGSESVAQGSTNLASLTARNSAYAVGDPITISGTNPDGTAFSDTFVYGTNGTTINDLITFINNTLDINQAEATLESNGNIRVTAGTAGEASLSLFIGDGAGTARVNWPNFTVSQDGTGPDTAVTSIDIVDAQGRTHPVTMTFTRNAGDPTIWDLNAEIDPSEGTINQGSIGQIRFNDNGSFNVIGGGTNTLAFTWNGISSQQSVSVDLGSSGQFDGVAMLGNTATVAAVDQDGYGVGTLLNAGFNTDGQLVGYYSNGQSQVLEQLRISMFSNEGGLLRSGDTMFVESPNSDDAIATIANSAGAGSVRSGQLENSNVDIAQEFVNLIEAQRGFQANSRVITTTDEILAELMNIVR
ncbi:MAG: flagellar hook-basal body complex protein [Planctomycetes bacterium]|nr:flagellar hook-basal body complex protein [Planctomycetota bacterium]MCB9884573.1 flagellar hook-basal body complex protein [Planctomycetota bacterium]